MAAIDEWPVQAGDDPFEAFYLTHKPAVYLTALRHLNNRDDAEEITQETFLSAYRALARGTQPTAPRAWLLTIARNACRARFRKSTRHRQEVALENEIESA